MTVAGLRDRIVLVTGASRGIGAACARAAAAAGAAVVLAARDEEALDRLASEVTDAGGRALAVPTDVADAAAVQRLVERTLTAFGRLDAAVNNAAGGNHPPTPLADIPAEDYATVLGVTLTGVFLSMKHEIPAMLSTGGGAIVNMASTGGLEAVGGLAGYVSAKFGVVGLTRTAALDYARAGIRVNALAPGPIRTGPLASAGKPAQEHAAAAVPVGRLGEAADVAAAAVWLCSDEAAFVTGATLPVDGGLLAGMPAFTGPAGLGRSADRHG